MGGGCDEECKEKSKAWRYDRHVLHQTFEIRNMHLSRLRWKEKIGGGSFLEGDRFEDVKTKLGELQGGLGIFRLTKRKMKIKF